MGKIKTAAQVAVATAVYLSGRVPDDETCDGSPAPAKRSGK